MTKAFLALVSMTTTPLGIVVVFSSFLPTTIPVGEAGGIQPTNVSTSSYGRETATFALGAGSVISSYRIQTISVIPGQSIELRVTASDDAAQFELIADAGAVARRDDRSWNWRAPEKPGRYGMRVIRRNMPDTIVVNAFVTVPKERLEGEYLNGYRIGRYPRPPRPIYNHPDGFIEVTPENLDVRVSPHFKLRQFVCKQQSGYPKYLVLDRSLLTKLEILLERFNAAGYHANSFNVMSGYRTPHYNRAIGNVALSRHVWGAAADVFVDEDGDDYMDDINGDGKSDTSDIKILYDIANELAAEADYQVFLGGLGTYRANRAHGPYLHVDVRGRRARWSR